MPCRSRDGHLIPKQKNHLQMLLSVFRVGAALADDFIFYKIPLCRKPLPLGEVSSLAMTERARKLTGKHTHSDNIAITKAKNHAVHSGSFEPGLPSQALRASSPKRRACFAYFHSCSATSSSTLPAMQRALSEMVLQFFFCSLRGSMSAIFIPFGTL